MTSWYNTPYIVWYNIIFNWTSPSLIKKWNYMKLSIFYVNYTNLHQIQSIIRFPYWIWPTPKCLYKCSHWLYLYCISYTHSTGYITNYFLYLTVISTDASFDINIPGKRRLWESNVLFCTNIIIIMVYNMLAANYILWNEAGNRFV